MPQIVIAAVTSAVAKMIEIWRILLSFGIVELQSTNGQASGATAMLELFYGRRSTIRRLRAVTYGTQFA
jgi:hypothetical protein